MNCIKVMIVADHPIMRDGLRSAVQHEVGMSVAGEASAVAEALFELRRCDPHVVLVDLQSPRDAGLQVISALRKFSPDVPIVFLTTYPWERGGGARHSLERVFPVSRTDSSEQIILQLRTVLGR
jgi:DNA-binding NarL/FixJ family response regulator